MSMRESGGGSSAQQQQSSAAQNFKPKSDWKHEEQASFLFVYLPGFAVDQLTITPDISNASVRIEGKRRLPNNTMLPVDETFAIPQHLDLSKMDKQFGRGIVMLKIPINPHPQAAAEDTPKLDPPQQKPEEKSVDVDNGGERTSAMDETAKTDQGKPQVAVKNNGDEVKDDRRKGSVTKAAKFDERVKGNKAMVKEDKALIVNMGIAAFILMGLGVSLLYTLGH